MEHECGDAIIYQTANLIIHPFTDCDISRLADFGRPEIARMMLTLLSPWPEDNIREWVQKSVYKGHVGFRAGAYFQGQLAGFVGIGGDPVTVAYAVHPDFQGRGFGSEMMQGLAVWAFEHGGVEMIEADHFLDNPVSGRILRKCGFKEYGTEMGKSAARLEPGPLVLYRLTRQHFDALNKRATL